MRLKILSLFVFCFLFRNNLLFAQEGPTIPPGVSAEILEKKAREEAQKKLFKKKAPQTIDIEAEKPSEEIKETATFYVQKINLESGPAAGDQMPIRIRESIVEDNKVIEPDDLTAIMKSYEGRELTLEEVRVLSQELEKKYRSLGFFALVYMPPQSIEKGELTLKVIVARMGDLYVEGQRYFGESKTRSYWKIPEGSVLSYSELRKSVTAMNANPDRTVRSILKAGSEVGKADVVLQQEDHFPIHAGYSLDNQGVRLTGKYRDTFTLRHNNLLGLDDIFLIGTIFSEDSEVYFSQYVIPVMDLGTNLVVGYSDSHVNPRGAVESSDIQGISRTYGVDFRHKILDTDTTSVEGHLGFDYKRKKAVILAETSVREILRVVTLGVESQALDETGSWDNRQDLSWGVSPHGNGARLTSRRAQTAFFKYSFLVRRQQQLFLGTKGILSFQGQFSPDKLTPQEELFIGGATSVRGYPESDYGADQGILTRAEFLSPLPYVGTSFKKNVYLITFLDYGYGWLTDPSASELRARNFLGTGAGLNVKFLENVSGQFEWGFPVGDNPVTEDRHSQFYLRFQADI